MDIYVSWNVVFYLKHDISTHRNSYPVEPVILCRKYDFFAFHKCAFRGLAKIRHILVQGRVPIVVTS